LGREIGKGKKGHGVELEKKSTVLELQRQSADERISKKENGQ